MDTLLIVVTCLSTAAAVTLGILLAIVLRQERRRSDARVIALAEMASGDFSIDPPTADPIALRPEHPLFAGYVAPEVDLAAADGQNLEARRALFAGEESASPWVPRAAVAAGLALVVLLGAAAASWSRSAPAAAPAEQPAGARVAAPLDLLRLQHEAREDGLTIQGVVQNPHESFPLEGVTAAAFLFGHDGRLIATGRAPVDYSMLRPGDESPFVVRVAVRENVARYRIGFRAPDGRVIAHVDRRASDVMAQSGASGR